MHPVIAFLHEQARAVRQLEADADQALHQENDPDGYRDCLLEKVELLSSLPEDMEPLLEGLDPQMRQEAKTAVRQFARRAEQAMEVNSIFFMRQLLYSEDYQEGQPNNLERFISRLQSRPD